jgi:hypothetical protein
MGKRRNNIIVILFVLTAIIAFLNANYRNAFKTSDQGKSELRLNYGDQEIQEPKGNSVEMDFKGLNNDSVHLPVDICNKITASFQEHNWNDVFNETNISFIYHETIFTGSPAFDNENNSKYIVVVFTNISGNHYHSAKGRISLFEFANTKDTWQLVQKHLVFGYGDEYGLEPLDIELAQIGANDKYALIVHTGYSCMGHDRETKAVYAWVGSLFLPVFEFTNYEYYEDYPRDIEYNEGYSDMRFLKSNKSWFDIETKSEDTEWDDKTPGAVRRYVFNGKEYVETILLPHQKTF